MLPTCAQEEYKGELNNIFQDKFNIILSQQLTHERSYISQQFTHERSYITLKLLPTCAQEEYMLSINFSMLVHSVALKAAVLAGMDALPGAPTIKENYPI